MLCTCISKLPCGLAALHELCMLLRHSARPSTTCTCLQFCPAPPAGRGLIEMWSCVRQEETEEAPSLQEMQKYNTSELQLPQVPLLQGGTRMKAKPTRIPSWAAAPRR